MLHDHRHGFSTFVRPLVANGYQGEALTMVVAIGAIIWQIAAGVDYPTVPPSPIILGVAVLVVLFVRATWVRIIGIVVPLFLLVGGTIASVADDDNALRHPGDAPRSSRRASNSRRSPSHSSRALWRFATVDPERNPRQSPEVA